ncbi:Rrf2 family transcriptional regulator [Rhizobium laguerreae]|uniref:Rrf2 family transcriptional regulator n=1 Tax=Rhizobium laguerreae TaxID=1076926 RepID=UPI001C918137|nr:Rrf2 family transcriptional regulator [Rhizobium laguerreae]MBY3100051.1 Rrf2 family transcriptional regulator [Rhizobium laguerreae]MBY3140648.1 Rrf2 family transcriptional regulator [Rhizobium laguerreae]MBY3153412.1 Rrf2 family transcriptional regulator [Rhizobium laguerreae]MBY3215300.1 Rrf2 family transcriptional regulator [Rhizobium laguerreae]MBY3264667.1 Rrf2 family transcriptional regulator [Rhizobium laguerreae]
MRNDSRLSRMLHVLIHMDKHQHSATSDMIAKMLNTNPVVVRRTMAGLREQGYVRSEKGHGGGWTLVRPLSEITLLDVYRAIGEPHLFAIGPADDQPRCLVEQAVNVALGDAMKEAQALLLQRLDSVTLDKIAADFEEKLTARPATSYSCAS